MANRVQEIQGHSDVKQWNYVKDKKGDLKQLMIHWTCIPVAKRRTLAKL